MKAILVADVPDEFIEGKVTHIDIVHPEDENRVYRIEGWSLPQFIPLFTKLKPKKEIAKTPVMLDNKEVSRVVRLHGAKIVEVNPTYSTIEKTGITDDILSLYESLNELGAVLQFVRSGRICITKSRVEHLDTYLAKRELERNGLQ